MRQFQRCKERHAKVTKNLRIFKNQNFRVQGESCGILLQTSPTSNPSFLHTTTVNNSLQRTKGQSSGGNYRDNYLTSECTALSFRTLEKPRPNYNVQTLYGVSVFLPTAKISKFHYRSCMEGTKHSTRIFARASGQPRRPRDERSAFKRVSLSSSGASSFSLSTPCRLIN